jgi:hypothetical protein
MSKNQRQTARKPATKFAHLQKKMRKQKVQAKKSRRKCPTHNSGWVLVANDKNGVQPENGLGVKHMEPATVALRAASGILHGRGWSYGGANWEVRSCQPTISSVWRVARSSPRNRRSRNMIAKSG